MLGKSTIAAIAFGVLLSNSPASADPETVARQLGEHLANCDAEGWLSMRSENSVMFGRSFRYKGRQQLSLFIDHVMSNSCVDGVNTTVITGYKASDKLVQIFWTNEVGGITGVDTVLIEDGKVEGQSTAMFPLVANTVSQ